MMLRSLAGRRFGPDADHSGAAGLARPHGKIPAKAIGEILDPKQNVTLGIRILTEPGWFQRENNPGCGRL